MLFLALHLLQNHSKKTEPTPLLDSEVFAFTFGAPAKRNQQFLVEKIMPHLFLEVLKSPNYEMGQKQALYQQRLASFGTAKKSNILHLIYLTIYDDTTKPCQIIALGALVGVAP